MLEFMAKPPTLGRNLLDMDEYYDILHATGLPAPWVGSVRSPHLWNKGYEEMPIGNLPVVSVISKNEGPYEDLGGLGSQVVNLDPTKRYRVSVWIYTENPYSDNNTNFYLGCNDNAVHQPINSTTGDAAPNPYFAIAASRNIPQKEWMLLVGYINPYGSGNKVSESACYRRNGTTVPLLSSNEFRFPISTTYGLKFRLNCHYGNRENALFKMACPRLEELGNESPTIQDLLSTHHG